MTSRTTVDGTGEIREIQRLLVNEWRITSTSLVCRASVWQEARQYHPHRLILGLDEDASGDGPCRVL